MSFERECWSLPELLPEREGWPLRIEEGCPTSQLRSRLHAIPLKNLKFTIKVQKAANTLNLPKSIGRPRKIEHWIATYLPEGFQYLWKFSNGLPITTCHLRESVEAQEAKYVERWPNTTSAWAGWSRFDIPVDRYGGVHSLLICTGSILGSPTCR